MGGFEDGFERDLRLKGLPVDRHVSQEHVDPATGAIRGMLAPDSPAGASVPSAAPPLWRLISSKLRPSLLQHRRAAGPVLPALHDHVAVLRIQLHQPRLAPGLLARDQRGARAAERIQHDVAGSCSSSGSPARPAPPASWSDGDRSAPACRRTRRRPDPARRTSSDRAPPASRRGSARTAVDNRRGRA